MTIDAMGCQVELAEKIVARGANFLLHVKGNQPSLQKDIHDHFVNIFGSTEDAKPLKIDKLESSVKGYEREEKGNIG